MKTCSLCGKEYDDELTVCPECGAAESEEFSEAVSEATVNEPEDETATEMTENIEVESENTEPEESEVAAQAEEEPEVEETEAVADAEEEVEETVASVKPAKKRKRGLAEAILGILCPSTALTSCLLTHVLVILASVIVALLFPYLLATVPIALPIINVVTVIISLVACIFCFVGFFLSIVALAAKGNKIGIAGLVMSILFTVAIVLVEIISIAAPYILLELLLL